MNSDRFKQIEEIYHAALEVAFEKQAAFLADKCRDDLELKKEVEALLYFEANPVGFIDASPDDLAAEILAQKENTNNFVNKRIGRYDVQKIIGEGGMGTVYLAHDTRLARRVALKVLPAEMVASRDRVQRFMHEARAASALNHPHILTVYEIDEIAGENGEAVHYISMEYVDGPTFDKLIYSNNTSANELLKFLSQAAQGLAKAHSAGIIHRDLKPENIMVSSDGYAKILDFGLAKLTDTEHELHALQQHRSRSGVILGTLGYMSPEQALGKTDIDNASDIFAFGCILYETLAKRKAFAAATTIDALHQIIHAEPVPIKDFCPNISDELNDLISQCLVKDPKKRFRNANQIASLLQRLASEKLDAVSASTGYDENRTIISNKAVTRESSSAQRRQVSVMFTDVSTITEMLEEFDPEHSSQIMNELWDFLEGLIVKGGGKIGERLADTVLSIWGTELIRESDPENCVRTALSLQTALSEYFNDNLSKEIVLSDLEKEELKKTQFLKISISTGTVLVGNTTDTGEFITAGSAVNGAKRLLSQASSGEIFVSHETYRHIRGIFQVDEVKAAPLKTTRHRSNIYSITGVKPRAFRMETRGVEGIETLLVGRETELKRMLTALDAVKEDKELQAVTVVGEAGLGKSRLLFEFHDRLELAADTFFVFNARGSETMRGLPFSLVRELFLFRFEVQESDSKVVAREKFVSGMIEMTSGTPGKFGTGEDAEMKAHFIGHLIGLDFSGSPHLGKVIDGEKQVQDRAFLYSAQFFSAVSRKYPVCVYLDDLHWADDESLNFFDLISRQCAQDAILITEFTRPILFERRPHWGEGQPNRIRLNLQPLTKRESGELINSILQNAEIIPAALHDILISNTEGNPFYLEELIKMFVEQGAINAAGEKWTIDATRLGEITVPPTLTGVLQSRLDKLSLTEKKVLQRASVVGREFWDNALQDVESAHTVSAALESLRRKELLFRKEVSVFDDANEYVFKHALLRDVAYETVLLDERRAWHLATADWLVRTKGERRNEYLAMIAGHFEKAGEARNSAFWYGKAGEQASQSHALQMAEQYLTKALEFWKEIPATDDESQPTADQILEWKYYLGRSVFGQGRFPEAVAAFTELLKTATRLNKKIAQAFAYWGLSFTQFEAGETRISLNCAKEVMRLAADDEIASSEKASFLMGAGLFRRARALLSLGDIEEAISLAERIVDSGSYSKTKGLHLLSAANRMSGRPKEAREYCLQEIASARQNGDLRTVADGLNSLGFQEYLNGNIPGAMPHYDEALEIARDIGHRNGMILIRSNIGGARVYLEEYEAAENELKTLIAEVGDRGYFLVNEMYRFLAEALIGRGKYREALEAAKKSLALSIETENQETIGEAWRVLGIISSCLKESILIDAETFGADDCFQRSLDTFKKVGMEVNYAQTLYNFAQHHLSTGNRLKADELFGTESEISNRLGINTAAKCVYVPSEPLAGG